MPTVLVWLGRLDRAVFEVCRAAGVASLVGVVLVALAQVLCRYLLRQPLVWSEELATYLFIWLCMLGAALAVRDKTHYAFDALLRCAPALVRRLVNVLLLLICLAVSVAIGHLGAQMAMSATDTSASLDVRMLWFYLAIPFGAWAMVVHFTMQLATTLWGGDDGELAA